MWIRIASGVIGSCVLLPASKRIVRWRYRALGKGEDVGTLAREGPGLTTVGGEDVTSLDRT